jgi:MFS family permease
MGTEYGGNRLTMEKKITVKGLLVWIITSLFFMYEFLLRTALGTFQTDVMRDLHLTPMFFSLISSTAFQVVYGAMQIPAGVILTRLGLKWTLIVAAMLCAIATIGFSTTHQFITAMICRALMGLGSSFGFICMLVAIYDWMPRKNIALFIGISQFIGTIGPMLAAGPLESLSSISLISWRDLFSSLSIPGFVLAMLIGLFVDHNRLDSPKYVILTHDYSIVVKLFQLLKHTQIWFIALYSGCIYFSIEYLAENNGAIFLMQKGLSSKVASYMITLAWMGYAFGSPILGFMSDKLQRRKPFLILGSLLTLLSLTGIIYFSLPDTSTGVCFLLLGIGASSSCTGFVIMAEQCRSDTLATGLGLNNMFIVSISAIFAPLIGMTLSYFTKTLVSPIIPYQYALTLLPLLVIPTLLIALYGIKETFCKSVSMNTVLKPKK